MVETWSLTHVLFDTNQAFHFKRMFLNYMRFRHPGIKYKWNSDYSSFHKLGYRITHKNICKGCNSIATTNCCSEYNHANRCKRYIIEDIACVENNV